MPTLKDVAKDVGVSVATVSYVLNNSGSVGEAVREKVLAAVERLNYRPNRQAQAMRTGLSRSIGLVLPDLTNPFFPELAQKVENEARSRGIIVILIDTQNCPEAEKQGLIMLGQQSVDGIIWCPVGDTAPSTLKEARCPVVLIDRPIAGFDVVQSDYRVGGALAAEHAIALGHKRVGLLSGPSSVASAVQRRAGFLERASNNLEVIWDINVPFTTELTDEARERLRAKDVTMVVAAADLIAVGAMNYLGESGLKVPQDISLIGFDDIPWAIILRPKLTTISQPTAEIGREAVEVLAQRIKDPQKPVRSVVLEVELKVRDSTRSMI
ncbi:MAG: LacI family transcriptional regulator [Alteromonadaceae bacterium]|nr:MAG: LacI family transcriptional regulator [Alteromonadaceae bacterium]